MGPGLGPNESSAGPNLVPYPFPMGPNVSRSRAHRNGGRPKRGPKIRDGAIVHTLSLDRSVLISLCISLSVYTCPGHLVLIKAHLKVALAPENKEYLGESVLCECWDSGHANLMSVAGACQEYTLLAG
jgi:hypothetical protein